MGKNKEQLLTAKEVIDKFYNRFEIKSEKMVFHNKVEVIYHKDSEEHRTDYNYAYYTECLKINSNIIAKGKLDYNDYEFIRVFSLSNEEIIKELEKYNYYKSNFASNIILKESNNLEFCPIMEKVLDARKIKGKLTMPLGRWETLREPKYEILVENYYEALMAKKETINSFIKIDAFAEKQENRHEKYSKKIVKFLATELENLLK